MARPSLSVIYSERLSVPTRNYSVNCIYDRTVLDIGQIMARRFSELNRIYKAVKEAGIDPSTLNATSLIRKYADWVENPAGRTTVTRTSTGRRVKVGIEAFSYDATNVNRLKLVQISGTANTRFTALSATATFGVDVAPGATFVRDAGFIPAKVKLAKRRNTPGTGISNITGANYKKRTEEPFTAVHGQTATLNSYTESIQAILALPIIVGSAQSQGYVATFEPEKITAL